MNQLLYAISGNSELVRLADNLPNLYQPYTYLCHKKAILWLCCYLNPIALLKFEIVENMLMSHCLMEGIVIRYSESSNVASTTNI